MLDPKTSKAIYRVKAPELYEMTLKQAGAFWLPGAIDYTEDKDDYDDLTDAEKGILDPVLGWFAQSDAVVNANLDENIMKRVHLNDILHFCATQASIEWIHQLVYTQFVDTLIVEKEHRDKVLNGLTTWSSVKLKIDLMKKWGSEESWTGDGTVTELAEHAAAMAAAEGILFMGSFCVVFWFKRNKKMLSFAKANEFIGRDEGFHRDAWAIVFRMADGLRNVPRARAAEILTSFADAEKAFVRELLPEQVKDLKQEDVCGYIEFITDAVMVRLGYDKLYGTPNPLPWMLLMMVEAKSNFFETRPSEYAKVGSGYALNENDEDDF